MEQIKPIVYNTDQPFLQRLSCAYTELLMLTTAERIKIQMSLSIIRDTISSFTGISSQTIQDDHEERAMQVKIGSPQVVN